ncbi:MAG: ribosomal protein S18 acetylase RimI-like enzyme [Candidatus Azotimanducaceae bacterium]
MATRTTIAIELAKPADCIELADLSRVAIEYGLRWRWKPSRILNMIRHKDCSVIVARTPDNEVAGFAAMEFHELHGYLCLLATPLRFRRQGVGLQLLEWLEASARIAALNYIALEVREKNTSAVRFYETAGYQIQVLKPDYYDGQEDAYRMSHELISADVSVRRP